MRLRQEVADGTAGEAPPHHPPPLGAIKARCLPTAKYLGFLLPPALCKRHWHRRQFGLPGTLASIWASFTFWGSMGTIKGKILRSFGLHERANQADADGEERRLLIAEHRKPENQRPRKITYHEIMEDLATRKPGRFLDRKFQALMSFDQWPPTTMTETFDKVRESGVDNAWTTSVPAVEKLLMVSHADVFHSVQLQLGPPRATFTIDGVRYQVKGGSPAMALAAAHATANRLRNPADDGTTGLGPHVRVLDVE